MHNDEYLNKIIKMIKCHYYYLYYVLIQMKYNNIQLIICNIKRSTIYLLC